jgi:oligopeptide transport system substrate-binding protein
MKEPDGTDFGKDKDRYRKLCGFDKDAALEHWEKGLKELGISKLRVELLTSPDEQLMEIIEDQLESTLPGLDLVIRTVTMSQLINLTMNGDFELVSARWGADYPDANSFLSLFYSKGTMDYSSYESARYDALVERSLMETDPEERVKLLHRAEDLLMEDLPFIPFYSPGQSWMIRENVKNVCIDFTGLLIDPSFAVKE